MDICAPDDMINIIKNSEHIKEMIDYHDDLTLKKKSESKVEWFEFDEARTLEVNVL